MAYHWGIYKWTKTLVKNATNIMTVLRRTFWKNCFSKYKFFTVLLTLLIFIYPCFSLKRLVLCFMFRYMFQWRNIFRQPTHKIWRLVICGYNCIIINNDLSWGACALVIISSLWLLKRYILVIVFKDICV